MQHRKFISVAIEFNPLISIPFHADDKTCDGYHEQSREVNNGSFGLFHSDKKYYLAIAGSTLIFNLLTMCYGIIQYNHFGKPLWNNTFSYIECAIPIGILFSVPVALLLTFAETIIRRFCTSKLLLFSILIIIFTVGWLWVTFEISSSYILEYGNTWTDAEIFYEMIFPCPLFTVLMVATGFLITRVYGRKGSYR